MACTYRFKDASGKEVVITGQAAMKAYLAEGGLKELMGDGVMTTPVAAHAATMEAAREGTLTPEQFKASFEAVVSGAEAIKAELSVKTKADLLKMGGPFVQMRYANDKKADVVDAVYREMVGNYTLGAGVSYGMGKNSYENAVQRMVDATDADRLAQYANDYKEAVAEAANRRVALAQSIADPKTLDDFRSAIRAGMLDGKTRAEAFLDLTPEQRMRYDELEAESTREAREARKRAAKTEVRAAGATTGGQIIATKHTRDGYDLFVVQLSDRLSADDYKTVLASAKRMGGWYSSFRGNGAIPGFQFKDRESADAFLKLAGGDTTDAKSKAEQRRDAFSDDRSQTAVERLREMADRLDDAADEQLNRDRKTNTDRRARFASAALNAAEGEKALAKTMRNIAQAIADGKAKFLDSVRTRTQVEALAGYVRAAKDKELRTKHQSYADQEKRKGEPATAETADFADFPSFRAYRSDLAMLGRQLLEVEGTKKLGQRLMSVADDVTDAYLDFAKSNLLAVSQFGRGDSMADFSSKADAEKAIRRSGLTGKAIVLPVKRGQSRVILSPSEAINRKVWEGDQDKLITLTAEFGGELVEAIGRRGNKQNGLSVPWQFQTAYDRRKALSRIGIETASEFRSALREFISLQERATANRVREMELQMVGRKADGLDFFPTPASVADQMVEAADIQPDMAVLEPSAGMGHIADRIREAGAEPDVAEFSGDRRDLLQEKGYNVVGDDFMGIKPREFFTYGDVFRAPDGTEGIMQGSGGMGSNRVGLRSESGDLLGWFNRDELIGLRHRGTESGYDRIIMNPPFSNRRDAEHVRHAYSLLKPGGRIVAIMGEGVFFGQDRKAQEFRDWLESVGGTSEKLPAGSFLDPSLPVNTGVSARMVVIDRPQGDVTTAEEGASVLRDSTAEPDQSGPTREQAEDFIRRFVAEYPAAPEIILSDSFYQLPERIQQDATAQGSGPARAKGALKNGKAYVILNNHRSMADLEATLFHEVLGHSGIRKLLGENFSRELNKLFIGLGGYSGLKRIMDKRGMGAQFEGYMGGVDQARTKNPDAWTDALAQSILTEEVFAHIAEQKTSKVLRDRFMALVGMVRDWLRKHGFAELADLGESDIVFMLQRAREGLRNGDGVVRDGVTVGESVIVDSRGRPLAKEGSPEYEAMKILSERLGLRETTGPTVFSDSLPDSEPSQNEPSATSSPDAPSVFRTEVVGPRSVRTRLAEFFDSLNGESAKTFNWWQRTIGSQYGKAKSDRDFGRVYDAAHAFLDGVADFAKSASALAPNILPHLDTLRDVAKGANVKRQWSDSKDYQAISSAIFEGTLSNGTTGQVWSDQELRDRFGLNDRQISLYREFRQSVDFSLETLAASEMARLARAAKLEVAGRDVGMDEALAFYMKQLDPILKEARAAVEGKAAEFVARHAEERAVLADASVNLTDAQTKLLRDEMDRRHKRELDDLMAVERDAEALRDSFVGSVEQIRRLEEQGYAPLMRFGQYTVDVVKLDEEGKPAKDEEGAADRPFFGMFETESEAKRAAKILSEEYPGYAVTQGVLSVDSSQLYRGLTPETAELFARLLGTDEAGAFQAYLKQAVANRSATKRLINRMGIEGFSNDVPRVLAAFITSNARLASGNWHFGEMNKAAEAIPKHKGDVKDEAIRLMQYVQNPQEEAAGLRGFLFFSFLGGSIASAITNLTQTFSTTLPYLHQFAGPAVAKVLPKAMALSGKMMTKGLDAVPPGELRDALKKASDEGVVDPQEIHLLMAESGGNGASIGLSGIAGAINKEWATPAARVTRSLTQAWGMFFGAAEKYNRHVAFIAAWEVAPDGVDRYEFAKNAVTETQFDYTKASRPNWARGAVGATLFTFKTFMVNYLEFLSRLPSRERAVALGVLFLMAGLSGMPGGDDLEDVIDTIGQKMGYNWNSAAIRHAWLVKTLTAGGADFVERGLSSLLPLDVSARLGLGNLIPASGVLMKSNDKPARDIQEFFGPIGSVFASGKDVFDNIGTGKGAFEMVKPLAPKSMGDIAQAIDMIQTGQYRDRAGRKVVDVDALDAAIKAIGFQPNVVAGPRRVERMLAQSADMHRAVRQDIHTLMARGRYEGDADKVEAAREMMRSWNEKNPETPIRLNPTSVAQRVRAMRQTSAERLVKATPKDMRGALSAELAVSQ